MAATQLATFTTTRWPPALPALIVASHQLLVLAIWGVVGGFVAIRRFRWDPRPE
jgi:hypothetical protein